MNFFDVDRRTTDFNNLYAKGSSAVFKETGYGLIKEYHTKKTLKEKIHLISEDFDKKRKCTKCH